jgi:hypothetical protein
MASIMIQRTSLGSFSSANKERVAEEQNGGEAEPLQGIAHVRAFGEVQLGQAGDGESGLRSIGGLLDIDF